MKSKEKTYRPASISILTEGIRNMLFGELSARYLSRNYASVKSRLEEFLLTEKESTSSYLSARSMIPGVSTLPAVNGGYPAGWRHPFYRYAVQGLAPFHPLCEFYRDFVHLECRMILTETECWRHSANLSNSELHFRIVALMELFAVYFRLSDERSSEAMYAGSGLPKKLRAYLARLLKYELGAVLLEISIRFDKLLGPKTVTPEKLYIHILNQVPPDPLPFYVTRYLVRYTMVRSNMNTDPVAKLPELMKRFVSTRQPIDESQKKEQAAIRRLIENTCSAGIILKSAGASDSEISQLWKEPDKSDKVISHYLKQIEEGKAEELKNIIFSRLSRLGKVMESRQDGESPSEARVLLQSLKHSGIFCKQDMQEGERIIAKQEQRPVAEEEGHPVLRDLVSIDELRERLQISMVTLNKYLEESGIPVIKFSAKSRWLRSHDCQKFLDYFTTNNGRDVEE